MPITHGMWNKHRSAGGGLSRELLNLDNCRHLSPDHGKEEETRALCLIALEMPLNSAHSEVWRLELFWWVPFLSLRSSLPSSKAHTSGMNKISYLWGAAHTATTVQQSSQSLQSKEWHLLVIQGAPWFYQPILPCDHRLCHPLICGLQSCDPLHLICKLGWTVSELTFTALSCAILFSILNTKSKEKAGGHACIHHPTGKQNSADLDYTP